jgi:hypothetical protein
MVAMSRGIAHGMRVLAWQIRLGWQAALSYQPFLLVNTYLLAGGGFKKINWLVIQPRTAKEPLLARRHFTFLKPSANCGR